MRECLNNKGVAYASLKRYEDAIVSFDKALSLYPDYRHASTTKACLCQTEKIPRGDHLLRQDPRHQPGDPDVLTAKELHLMI